MTTLEEGEAYRTSRQVAIRTVLLDTFPIFHPGNLSYHSGMSQETKTLSFDMQDWIGRCRGALAHLSTPPYLDAEIPELEQNLPFDYESARAKPELVQQFAYTAETSLAPSPGDLGLRLAALYPLRRAALSNLWERADHSSFWATKEAVQMFKPTNEEIHIFKYLDALCVPEKLSSLNDLKFELHNAYLVLLCYKV